MNAGGGYGCVADPNGQLVKVADNVSGGMKTFYSRLLVTSTLTLPAPVQSARAQLRGPTGPDSPSPDREHRDRCVRRAQP